MSNKLPEDGWRTIAGLRRAQKYRRLSKILLEKREWHRQKSAAQIPKPLLALNVRLQ